MDKLVFEYNEKFLADILKDGAKNVTVFDGRVYMTPYVDLKSNQVTLVSEDGFIVHDSEGTDMVIVAPVEGNDIFTNRVFTAYENGVGISQKYIEFVVSTPGGEHGDFSFVSYSENYGMISSQMPGNYRLKPYYSVDDSQLDRIMASFNYFPANGYHKSNKTASIITREGLFEQWLDNNNGHVQLDQILMDAWMAGYEAGIKYGEKAK